MTIDQILRFLYKNGIKKIERVESGAGFGKDNESQWVVTETYGARTVFHVGKTPGKEVISTGNHVYT
jgi:hypothetical protein